MSRRLRLLGLAVDPFVEAFPGLRPSFFWLRSELKREFSGSSCPSSLATLAPTSRPTVSISSMGPIGMPKATAAASMSSLLSPFSTRCNRPDHVGHQHAIDEETRRRLDEHRALSNRQSKARTKCDVAVGIEGRANDFHERKLRDWVEKV